MNSPKLTYEYDSKIISEEMDKMIRGHIDLTIEKNIGRSMASISQINNASKIDADVLFISSTHCV